LEIYAVGKHALRVLLGFFFFVIDLKQGLSIICTLKHDNAREKSNVKYASSLCLYTSKRIRNPNNPCKTVQEVQNSFWNSSHITFTLYGTSYRTSNTMSCIVIVTDKFLAFVSIFWSSENLWWNMIHNSFTITSQI
jgi:hypothetical protein